MAFLRYSEPELRLLLARAISVRWPGEHIVILTPCLGDPPRSEPWHPLDEELPHGAGWAGAGNDAVLAATQSRLIYQERLTHTVLARAIAIILTVAAVATLFSGDGLAAFAMIGTAALTLWTAAKFAELFFVGRIAMEFERIDLVDQMGQRIEGTLHAGNRFRLRVLDPSDFRVILSLLNGFGHAPA